MEAEAIIARAESAIGRGIHYGLGKGGMNPGSPTPASHGECDCSGFVAWCLGMSRKTRERFYVQFNGGWIETTAVWTDIGRSVGIFEESERRPGAVVVYPDSRGHEGHIGIVIDKTHVVHCSSGNDQRTGDAVQSTGFQVFEARKDTRYGWLIGVR